MNGQNNKNVVTAATICFAWNLDIGEAAGQATGILALTWIAVSALIICTTKLWLNSQKMSQ